MIYAPGLHTGYGVKTLPGIREAIEERRWDEANRYIGVVSRSLSAYSARLDARFQFPSARLVVPQRTRVVIVPNPSHTYKETTYDRREAAKIHR